ncbi:tumor necrosis factor receptor superfamily member 6-like [Mobula hypostoma]|uniref:tumor necrosis factor receptor superfamily member 6-like n=1 Tax=Mobula hypostoma TaxID=723540 RepID=UPI002FC3A950
MKLLHLTALLVVVQNTKGAHLTTSTTSENDPSIASTYSSSHFSLRRLKRQSNCTPDQYLFEGVKCCNKCRAGTYEKKSCSHTSPSECHPCGEQEYTDSVNRLSECLPCNQCQEGNGQEVEIECRATSNTKCRCMKNYFCKTPEKCDRCFPCKECNTNTEEIVRICTRTNDTVCKAKGKQNYLWLIVLVPILVLVPLLYWKRKSLPCNKKKSFDTKESVAFIGSNSPKPEEPAVPDIDLTEDILQFIAGEIEPRAYHQLGIHLGLGEPKLQQLEADYRDDTKRQGYSILYSWLQSHGKKGAFPKLIEALRRESCAYAADKIMDVLINRKENDVTVLE